jgi:ribosomal protein S2
MPVVNDTVADADAVTEAMYVRVPLANSKHLDSAIVYVA